MLTYITTVPVADVKRLKSRLSVPSEELLDSGPRRQVKQGRQGTSYCRATASCGRKTSPDRLYQGTLHKLPRCLYGSCRKRNRLSLTHAKPALNVMFARPLAAIPYSILLVFYSVPT